MKLSLKFGVISIARNARAAYVAAAARAAAPAA
jgi:hypothetical protein